MRAKHTISEQVQVFDVQAIQIRVGGHVLSGDYETQLENRREIQKRINLYPELVEALNKIAVKTETDPAEGPELRARAESVHRLTTDMLSKIEGVK